MRSSGAVIPKRYLANEMALGDDLTIIETKSNDLNRTVRLARLVRKLEKSTWEEVLYDPQVLWMNEERFVLTGFERVRCDGRDVDYAQSWLCCVDVK